MAKRTAPFPPYNSIFLFPAPQSRPVDFVKIFPRVSPETKSKLEEINSARNNLLASVTADPSTGVIASKNYLPCLFGLIQAAQLLPPDSPTPNLSISWTSFIGVKYSTKYYTSDHWHYEAVNVLLSYTLQCRAKASVILISSQTSEATLLQACKEIVQELCTAAGVCNHIREVQLARWTHKPVEELPEKLTEIYTFLSALCLAEAQQIVIRKAIATGLSFVAIAKLSLDVHAKFRFMRDVLVSLGDFGKRILMPNIWFYIAGNAILYELYAFKLLGHEALHQGKYGEAIGYFAAGLQKADLSTLPVDRSSSAENFRKHIQQQQQDLKNAHDRALKDNSTIYFERVLPYAELNIPTGQTIVSPVPFTPPEPVEIPITFEEKAEGCMIM